jgi:hypothetical protein
MESPTSGGTVGGASVGGAAVAGGSVAVGGFVGAAVVAAPPQAVAISKITAATDRKRKKVEFLDMVILLV